MPEESEIIRKDGKSRSQSKEKKPLRLVGPEGLSARYILVPQIVNAGAFLSALYSSTTCQFMRVKYDYDWENAGSWLKTEVNFGILSRETADDKSDVCFWYTEQDFSTLFDTPLRVSVVANTISTLTGGLLFLYSLFLWCRLVTKSSIRFLCYVNSFCIISAVLTHVMFFSDVCMEEKCTRLFDGSQSACVYSYCRPGAGSYFSITAIVLWSVSLALTIRLLKKAEDQILKQKQLRKKLKARQKAQRDMEEGRRNTSNITQSDAQNGNKIDEHSKNHERKEVDQIYNKSEESKEEQKVDFDGRRKIDYEDNDAIIENEKIVVECTSFSIIMGDQPISKSSNKDIQLEEGKVEI